MPKEGKNDRFARRVCELLKSHLAAPCEYIGAPEHLLKERTAFGHQAVGVHLSGAHAPYCHLEFMLGTWHDRYEAARLRLGLAPKSEGTLHFWQTTGNLGTGWAEFKNRPGRWEANLNEDPATVMPEVIPYMTEAMRIVFDACGDLRRVRALLEPGFNGSLFTMEPWKEIVLIDVTLLDWEHLRAFLQRKDRAYAGSADPKLIERIENVFGIKCSNTT
jgi:hypothetical protein